MLAKKTVKNQITLPKAIVERLSKTDYFEVASAERKFACGRSLSKPREQSWTRFERR